MSAARASFSLFAPRAANCERCGVTKISMGNDVITRSTARKRILDPLTGGIFASVQRDAADCADSADLCIRKRKKEAPTCVTLWSCLAWRLCTSKRARVSFALAQLNHEFARKSATDATCACRGRDGALSDNQQAAVGRSCRGVARKCLTDSCIRAPQVVQLWEAN